MCPDDRRVGGVLTEDDRSTDGLGSIVTSSSRSCTKSLAGLERLCHRSRESAGPLRFGWRDDLQGVCPVSSRLPDIRVRRRHAGCPGRSRRRGPQASSSEASDSVVKRFDAVVGLVERRDADRCLAARHRLVSVVHSAPSKIAVSQQRCRTRSSRRRCTDRGREGTSRRGGRRPRGCRYAGTPTPLER